MPDEERVVLGIDIGGSKTVVAIGTPGGELLAQQRLEAWMTGAWATVSAN